MFDKIPDLKKLFSNKERLLFFMDKSYLILVIALLGFFSSDYLIIISFLLLFPYLIFSKRKTLIYYLGISFIFGLSWVMYAKEVYGYNLDYAKIGGLNLFPLFAWTMGLFAIYLFFSHYNNFFKIKSSLRKFLSFVLIYWFFLLTVETICYHVFGIQNVATSSYSGLPLCNCLHAPVWMQIAYFVIGPIYYLICSSMNYFIDSKNAL